MKEVFEIISNLITNVEVTGNFFYDTMLAYVLGKVVYLLAYKKVGDLNLDKPFRKPAHWTIRLFYFAVGWGILHFYWPHRKFFMNNFWWIVLGEIVFFTSIVAIIELYTKVRKTDNSN